MTENVIIPKIIHYCWFGRNPLPKSAKKCLASWRKYLPDFEIKEWNEDNFDVNVIPYTHDAYQAKKYAFVSDYARFWILYHYGGVYFDTDVEVIKPLDDLLKDGAFMGWETPSSDGAYKIAPGLGLAAPAQFPLYKEILGGFERLNFHLANGGINPYSMIPMVTDILSRKGLQLDGNTQRVAGVMIYAPAYFCPMNAVSGQVLITPKTYTIHWYTMSWLPKHRQWRVKMMRVLRRLLYSFSLFNK